MRDNFGEGEIRRIDIEVPLDNLQIRCELAQELVRLFVGEVTQAKDLADFPGSEELLELSPRRSVGARRDRTSCNLLWRVCPTSSISSFTPSRNAVVTIVGSSYSSTIRYEKVTDDQY